MAKPGRRPGPTQTRQAIIEEARAQFADKGYRATTVRAVATAAEVHPALIFHHFGTKQALYDAAFGAPIDDFEVLVRAVEDAPGDGGAEALVRHFVSTWRDPARGPALRSAARGWFGEQAGTELLREHAESVVIPALSSMFNVPEVHMAAAYTHLLGLVLADTLMGLSQLQATSQDDLVALITPSIHLYTMANEAPKTKPDAAQNRRPAHS
jgi:AcrR family transcriptional regulator